MLILFVAEIFAPVSACASITTLLVLIVERGCSLPSFLIIRLRLNFIDADFRFVDVWILTALILWVEAYVVARLLADVWAGVKSFPAIEKFDAKFLLCMTLYLGKWQFIIINAEILSLAPV